MSAKLNINVDDRDIRDFAEAVKCQIFDAMPADKAGAVRDLILRHPEPVTVTVDNQAWPDLTLRIEPSRVLIYAIRLRLDPLHKHLTGILTPRSAGKTFLYEELHEERLTPNEARERAGLPPLPRDGSR